MNEDDALHDYFDTISHFAGFPRHFTPTIINDDNIQVSAPYVDLANVLTAEGVHNHEFIIRLNPWKTHVLALYQY